MTGALVLFLVPTLLFVITFLYETYVSFKRLFKSNYGRANYVSATWEVTHTLLIFAVVMLLMLFTQTLDKLASAIFLSTFLAATALLIRSACYTYIFYARKKKIINWVDWVFAFCHVFAVAFLVITVVEALWYVLANKPPVNEQFIPAFIPGLILVLALCAVPIIALYKTKD